MFYFKNSGICTVTFLSLVDESVQQRSTLIAKGGTGVGMVFESVCGSTSLQKKKSNVRSRYKMIIYTIIGKIISVNVTFDNSEYHVAYATNILSF